jgi:hypothetical protein
MGEGEPIYQCLFFAAGRIDYWKTSRAIQTPRSKFFSDSGSPRKIGRLRKHGPRTSQFAVSWPLRIAPKTQRRNKARLAAAIELSWCNSPRVLRLVGGRWLDFTSTPHWYPPVLRH